MAELVQYTPTEIRDFLGQMFGLEYDDEEVEARRAAFEAAVQQVNLWIARGDGIAVYENHDMGHPNLGEKRVVSYGGPDAQLEPSTQTCAACGVKLGWNAQEGEYVHGRRDVNDMHEIAPLPPKTLPDIGGLIGWRYQLIGIYRGEESL